MKKKYINILVIIFLIAIFVISVSLIKNKNQDPILQNIKLPSNFKIDIFASDLGKSFYANPGPNRGVRFMEFYKDVLFVSVPSAGIIVALPDKNKDGKTDELIKVIDGLNRPHGIAFKDDYIYRK